MGISSFSNRHAFLLFKVSVLLCFLSVAETQNVSTVNIGALVSYETLIGTVAKKAIQMAVDDINRDPNMLIGSTLVLHMLNTNCSAFQGAAEAMGLMKKEVVAVVGPQSTAVSHFVAHMGGATQVPIVSFAATDPALSEFQYPYFFRIAHSDAVQMEAIAAFIGFYGWRQVIVLYTDDDFGSNGAAALSDALVSVGSRIVQKVPLIPSINKTTIGSVLTNLAAMQTRVIVVHMPQNLSFLLFSEAKYLGMMTSGYVWIVSDSTMGTLDPAIASTDTLKTLRGVVGLRGYYRSSSPQFQNFISEWKNQSTSNNETVELNLYGLYAYDAVWLVARALDNYLKTGLNVTFRDAPFDPHNAGSTSELAQLKVFEGGPVLRNNILECNFSGTSGYIQVNPKGDLIRSAFEFVNVVGNQLCVIGYWTNETQLSLSTPGSTIDVELNSLSSVDTKNSTFSVVWPGNYTATPRGWVLPSNGKPLKIAVPNKAGFKQFVSESANSTGLHGFCIDVFQASLKYLPYGVPYNFILYGNKTTPIYDDMIKMLANKEVDAVVGDLTITTKRMERVDFSQPYAESGLVVLVPTKHSHSSNAWAFLRPYSTTMWLTTLGFFVLTGVVIWMLEHKKNPDFRGRPKKQVVTVLWFSFSTLFFSHSESIRSTLGRFALIIWLFVVLIITASYTANLTSILTVQQLTPTIQGISSLQASNEPIGYQTGSFARDYLISINIAKERLKPLPSVGAYAEALQLGPSKGGVAAVVDELPYVQVFLGTHCGFTIAGQAFTKGGWGFAFPKDSELAVDMSTAILSMSETGELQRIHDLWLSTSQCGTDSNEVDSNQLDLSSFWGLFLITGIASVASLILYLIRLLCHFSRRDDSIESSDNNGSWSSRGARFIKSFAAYVDEPGHATSDQNKQKKKRKKNKKLTKQMTDGEMSSYHSDRTYAFNEHQSSHKFDLNSIECQTMNSNGT